MAKNGDLGRQSLWYTRWTPWNDPNFWGMSPAAFRASHYISKTTSKVQTEYVWVDDQTQPLPRSARQYLHGWIRAEELAMARWDAEVIIFEDNGGSKMSIIDMQLSHSQVLLRSSFCRRVLSMCFMLEKVDSLVVTFKLFIT